MNQYQPHVCPPPTKGTLKFDAFQAAKSGKVEKVKSFLEDGGDVNAGDSTGMTMLFTACDQGRIEVVEELMKYPNLHLNNRHKSVTALAVASLNGHDNCVKAILECSSQCQVNLDITCIFKSPKQITALSTAALAKQWTVFKILLKITEIINPDIAADILNSAMEDDQWDIIQEVLQKDINYQGSVYLTVLKEAYIRQLWDVVEVVFHKATIHDNNTVLIILSEMLRKKDWKKLESLLKVLSETVKVDINLAEALRVKQNQQVEKMLKEGSYDTDTISGALLVASIVGTSEKVANILVGQSHNYADTTLKFALILATIYNRLELVPLLLQMGKFSFKTLGKARALSDIYQCSDSIKLLKLSFSDKACSLFPNVMKRSQLDIEKTVLHDSDDDDM